MIDVKVERKLSKEDKKELHRLLKYTMENDEIKPEEKRQFIEICWSLYLLAKEGKLE